MSEFCNGFVKKTADKKLEIGIIGLGYVGFQVLGFDVDQNKIAKIYNKQSYIEHISSASVEKDLFIIR